MLPGAIVCVLVAMAGARAVKPGKPIDAQYVYGVPQRPPQDHRNYEHKPCCAPRYFTFNQAKHVMYVENGSLVIDFATSETAYDDVAKIVSGIVSEDFLNGTVYTYREILNYKEGVAYQIEKTGDDLECYVFDITREKFPEECVPKHAKFVSESTVGDHASLVDTWHYYDTIPDGTQEIIKIVQHDGCVPMGSITRTYHPETGEEIQLIDTRIFGFQLGICDPDKYFKVPDSCKEGRALANPTPKMLKMRRNGVFH